MLIATHLIQQQALNADSKAIQQINFMWNLNWGQSVDDNTTIFFFTEEAKETILDFLQRTVRVLKSYFLVM